MSQESQNSEPPDPEAFLQMQLKWLSETPGLLEGYDCLTCLNRGDIPFIRNGAIVVRECACMSKRRALWRIERSGLKDLISKCTFDNYKTPETWQRKAKELARKFAADPAGSWFAALGAVGSGKTHLCTAICCDLINTGYDTRYMLWKDEARQLKAAVNADEEYGRLIRPLQTVRVLYIDDFWKTRINDDTGRYEQPTQADINLAFEIINARYIDRKLITLISSERTCQELLNIDQAVGSRIAERSRGYCIDLEGDGKNWRLKL